MLLLVCNLCTGLEMTQYFAVEETIAGNIRTHGNAVWVLPFQPSEWHLPRLHFGWPRRRGVDF